MAYESLHLEPDEHVVLEVRKHWIVFAGQAFALVIGVFAPFIIMFAVRHFVPTLLNQVSVPDNSYAIGLFFYTLWILFLWISFFVQWTKYYLDVWYVTEKRIVDIEQKRFFDREISNVRFDRVEDVTVDVHGFISTMLNFGSVKVQTAGESDSTFTMTMVRHPDEVRRIIFSQQNEIGDTPIRHAKANTPPLK